MQPPAQPRCPKTQETHGRAAPRAPWKDRTGSPCRCPPQTPHLPAHPPTAPCGDDGFTGLRLGGGQPGLGCCGCLAQLCFLGLLLGPLSLLLGAALCSQLSFALAPCRLLAIVGAIGQGWGGRGVSSYCRRWKGEVCAQPPSPGDVAQYVGQPAAGRPSSAQGSAFGGAGGTKPRILQRLATPAQLTRDHQASPVFRWGGDWPLYISDPARRQALEVARTRTRAQRGGTPQRSHCGLP